MEERSRKGAMKFESLEAGESTASPRTEAGTVQAQGERGSGVGGEKGWHHHWDPAERDSTARSHTCSCGVSKSGCLASQWATLRSYLTSRVGSCVKPRCRTWLIGLS